MSLLNPRLSLVICATYRSIRWTNYLPMFQQKALQIRHGRSQTTFYWRQRPSSHPIYFNKPCPYLDFFIYLFKNKSWSQTKRASPPLQLSMNYNTTKPGRGRSDVCVCVCHTICHIPSSTKKRKDSRKTNIFFQNSQLCRIYTYRVLQTG